MSVSKPYRTIDEVIEIFKINLSTVKSVVKKYKVDTFINKGKIYVHMKDFYKAYTKHHNPTLRTKDEDISLTFLL